LLQLVTSRVILYQLLKVKNGCTLYKWFKTEGIPHADFLKEDRDCRFIIVGKKGNCKQKLQTSDVLDLKLCMERKNTSHLYKQISVLSLFSPLSYLCTKYANLKTQKPKPSIADNW